MLKINKFLNKNIYIILPSLFLFIISILIWLIFEANYIANTYSSRITAVNEIIIETTSAHLWFEELISGDKNEELEDVVNHILKAKLYINSLRTYNKKLNTSILKESNHILLLNSILIDLNKFKELTYIRYKKNKISKPGTSLDQYFDKVFLEMISKTNILKNIIKKEEDKEKSKFSYIQYIVLLFELLSFATVSLTIISFSKNKQDLIQQLEESNINLEKKVKKRTSELNIAISDLNKYQEKRIEKEKLASLGSLVSGIAHEINTPIGNSYTAITHFQVEKKLLIDKYQNNKMTEKDFDIFLDNTSELSKIIKTSLENTIELIKSFKMISGDQESNKKRLFNLEEYLKNIIISLNTEIKRKKIDIKILCDNTIEINSIVSIFVQIFTNLIQNSIVHAFDNTNNPKININVHLNNTHLSIIYKDNGKGIKQENLKKVFEPFFTTSKNSGSSGLGMNIVYNLITHKLKGEISCQSKENVDLCFYIKIPKKEIFI